MSVRLRVIALAVLVAAFAAGVAIVAARGPRAARSAAATGAERAAAFRGSPAVLAALHAQANELLGGGPAAFAARLRSLRGVPVVVNKWASWCGPCQFEFPAYQRAALAYGRTVAFIGLDGNDSDASAAAFLRRFPVSYPSYVDPDESIARTIHATTYFPQTVYISRQGRLVEDHAGPYATAGALERDIRRYLLG